MKSALFTEREARRALRAIVGELPIGHEEWEMCFSENRHAERIERGRQAAVRFSVESTPSFIIGTRMVSANLGSQEFEQYVEEAMRHRSSALSRRS